MLIPRDVSTSRLIDRLVDEGLAARRECKIDKRGQFVEITDAGRAETLQKKMSRRLFGRDQSTSDLSKLSDTDAIKPARCSTGWATPARRRCRRPARVRPRDELVFTPYVRACPGRPADFPGTARIRAPCP